MPCGHKEYSENTALSPFTHKDISRLRSWMTRLDSAGISFLVSYVESDEADVLKRGFRYETIPVRRNVAGFAAHRALANELSNLKRLGGEHAQS